MLVKLSPVYTNFRTKMLVLHEKPQELNFFQGLFELNCEIIPLAFHMLAFKSICIGRKGGCRKLNQNMVRRLVQWLTKPLEKLEPVYLLLHRLVGS